MPSPITFGRIVRSVPVSDSIVIETVHSAGLRLPRHDHGQASLNLTLAGAYDEVFSRRTVRSTPGTVVLKPAGEFHENRYGAAHTRCVMVEFGPRTTAWIADRSAILDQMWTSPRGPASDAMREIWSEAQSPDSASRLVIEGCLWRVLGLAERDRARATVSRVPRWLPWVEEFIRENAHRGLNLHEIAAVADVHPGHLTRTFRRCRRMSVGAYLRSVQIQRARRRLEESDAPIADIAAEAGFADQSHFTRVFKSQTGAPPASYRRTAGAARTKTR